VFSTRRFGVVFGSWQRFLSAPPNGSALSCGQRARRRKAVDESVPRQGTTLQFP